MIFSGTCVFFAHFCFRDETFNIRAGQVHLAGGGGSENFWPSTGGSEVNNPWSRGVHIF